MCKRHYLRPSPLGEGMGVRLTPPLRGGWVGLWRKLGELIDLLFLLHIKHQLAHKDSVLAILIITN